jgi:phosphoglucosamine mutase
LIDGATRAGGKCLSAGVITTPGVAFLTRKLDADAGVVISASHNPYQDNGIKIFAPSGQKMDDSVEQIIEADIFAGVDPTHPSSDTKAPAPEQERQLQHEYLHFLSDQIGEGLDLRNLKIVIDCANGASSALGPELFKRLGANVVAINASPDGRNINLNCGSLHIDSLRERVVTENADLGAAFDGDADRSLFVDEKGNFVDGDATLWVLASYLQSHGRLNAAGVKLVRTDVGDKYVLDELLRLKASLGGEQSGHIILPELSLAGDGMITALSLIRALRDSEKSLGQMTAGFQRYPQILLNVRVREKRQFAELPSVQAMVREVEEELENKGRLLLRYSGTEPLARVMIEGEHQRQIEIYAQKIASAIEREIGG